MRTILVLLLGLAIAVLVFRARSATRVRTVRPGS